MHDLHHDDQGGDVRGQTRDWDAFYRRDGEADRAWSGDPNPTLVAEVADLAPGAALDVGCGEGADALWLARRGWEVVAIDPSRIAIQRARAAAEAAGLEVDWIVDGLLELPDDLGPFDLVTAHYAVVRDTPDAAAARRLVRSVAPDGTLLVVHHELDGEHAADHQAGHGSDRSDLLLPADVRDHLDDRWLIEVDEARARPASVDPSRRHVRDLVVRARRASDGTRG